MDIEQYFPFPTINDAELINVIQHDNHNYPLNVINTLIYCNSDFNLSNHSADHLNEPTVPQPECDYNFCSDEISHKSPSNSLKILSFNISSVPKHLESFFDQCINPSGIPFDVIGLCETRLNSNICNLYKLNRYSSYFQNKSTQSGGVCIYLHNNFQGVKINNAFLQFPHIESLFIEILKAFHYIVGIIYRPPNSLFNDFLESMENILELLSNINAKCYIMEDFNINLLNMNDKVVNYTNLFYSYTFFQTIIKPTRVTSKSATLIDHIWTNNMQNYIKKRHFLHVNK